MATNTHDEEHEECDLEVYDMDHPQRGIAVIINNQIFDVKLKFEERIGSEKDEMMLQEVLGSEWLGFDVKVFNNRTADQILKILTEYSNMDHTQFDCFFAAIFSHGGDGIIYDSTGAPVHIADGFFYGTDGSPVHVHKLTESFQGDKCPTLVGKPKIFVVQACRGVTADPGGNLPTVIVADGPSSRIAAGSDFLYAYSSARGSPAFRSYIDGSWFIQALCKKIKRFAWSETMDFVRILTSVSHDVSYNKESNCSDKDFHKRKQAPTVETSLTKLLFLKPKTGSGRPILPANRAVVAHPAKKLTTEKQPISRGTYGVFKGRLQDVLQDEFVAVKEIIVPVDSVDSSFAKLEGELKGLKSLNHPHVIQYLGFRSSPQISQTDLPIYRIFMEICTGGALTQRVNKTEKVTLQDIQKWAHGVLLGLDYLHNKAHYGKAHKAIHGDHVMFKGPGIGCGDIKIISVPRIQEIRLVENRSHTRKLSMPFPPPELHEYVGSKTDMWSFGCLLVHMATGNEPVSDAQKKIPDIPKVPSKLQSLIKHCLSENRELRPTAAELIPSEFLKEQESWQRDCLRD